MAEFSSQLQDANILFSRPVRPVESQLARAVTQVTGTLADETARKRTSAVREELDTMEREFLEDTDRALNDAEAKEVDRFRKSMAKTVALRNSGMTTTQFKLLAEARLKQHVVAAPALENEFRQAALEAIGFDPTNAALHDRLAAVDAAMQQDTKAEQRRYDMYKKHNIELYFGTEKGEELLHALTSADLRLKTLDNQSKLSEHQLPQYGTGTYVQAREQAGGIIASKFGKTLEQMSLRELNSLDADSVFDAVAELEDTKRLLRTAFGSKALGVDPSKVDNNFRMTEDYIDNQIAMLNQEIPAELFKRREETFTSLLQSDLQNTTAGKQMLLWSKLMPGAPLPQTLENSAVKAFLDLTAGTVDTDMTGSDATKVAALMKKTARDVARMDNMSPDQANLLAKGFSAFALTSSVSDDANVKQAMLDSFSNPSSIKVFEAIDQSTSVPSKVREQVKSEAAVYFAQVASGLSAKVQKQDVAAKKLEVDKFFSGVGRPGVRMVDDPTKGPTITFEVNDQGLLQAVPSEEQYTSKAAHLQKSYLDRLNTSVKATAHMDKHKDYKSVLHNYVVNNPAQFGWLAFEVVDPSGAPE